MAPAATETQGSATSAKQESESYLSSSVLNDNVYSDNSNDLFQMPRFKDSLEERKWAKEHMAAAFRVFAKLGYSDAASGHISLRDPVNPSHFWINPYAVHFGQIKTSDLVLVNDEGVSISPTKYKINKAGFIIHSSIHKARPDINAACHVHSIYGRAWSAFGKPIEMLNQDSCLFYNDLAVYEGFGGIVLAAQEGQNIANALGPTKRNIILQNHGLLTCGKTVDEAAAFFIALERACQTQLLAEAAAANGLAKKCVGEAEAAYTKNFCGHGLMYMQFAPEYSMILEETNGAFLS